jgi:hypothetical protein
MLGREASKGENTLGDQEQNKEQVYHCHLEKITRMSM